MPPDPPKAEKEADWTGEKPGSEPAFPEKPLDPALILLFAKQIMFGCAIVGTIFALLALIGPPLLLACPKSVQTETEKYILSTGTSLLSVVTTVIPPIVTLVLGFYFGKKNSDRG